jgi:phage gp36-like protein
MAYATRTDLDALGYPSATLAGVSTTIQDDALDAASSLADGYLVRRFTLPLSAWGDDLRRAVVHIAAWDLLCRRGFSPNRDADDVVQVRHDQAMRWLRDVSAGRVEPQGVTDASPTVTDTFGVVVTSRPRRGW